MSNPTGKGGFKKGQSGNPGGHPVAVTPKPRPKVGLEKGRIA
jgi:hypothetical protein